jgi:hypothetical protein
MNPFLQEYWIVYFKQNRPPTFLWQHLFDCFSITESFMVPRLLKKSNIAAWSAIIDEAGPFGDGVPCEYGAWVRRVRSCKIGKKKGGKREREMPCLSE